MTSPRSLESLRKMRRRPKRSSGARSVSEATLDALLSQVNEQAKSGDTAGLPVLQQSPLDQLRDTFTEEFVPLVQSVGRRYAEKGVDVRMDASEFIGGGRELHIEIEYQDHRVCLVGTVMADSIAFRETRFSGESGGIVVGGPVLRTRHLTGQVFADFLYDRIIKLVRFVNRQGG